MTLYKAMERPQFLWANCIQSHMELLILPSFVCIFSRRGSSFFFLGGGLLLKIFWVAQRLKSVLKALPNCNFVDFAAAAW